MPKRFSKLGELLLGLAAQCTTPKYPHITVQLTGQDGNALAIMGRVVAAMRKTNIPKEEVEAFCTEAMSGNYQELLQTCCAYVTCK